MSVGKRITELFNILSKKNIVKNKQEFCFLLGIDYSNFSKYANDSIKYSINYENIDKIESLGINIRWLLKGEGEMFKDRVEEKIKSPKEIEREEKEREELRQCKLELQELRQEYDKLKKIVDELEEDNAKLSAELLERLRKLTDLQDRILNNENKLGFT
ncbi:MAG TPA: hypothetical protein PK771_07115 [Spirochaetota bacterium]|nr:hypothetical protein [Spirochaetota bacterium]